MSMTTKNPFESALDTDKLEIGVWRQPDHPVTGLPFTVNHGGEDLPARIRLRSTDSTAYRGLRTERSKKNIGTMVQRGGKKGQNQLVANTTKEMRHEDFATLVSGFENITQKGVTEPSYEDLIAFCTDGKGNLRTGIVWLLDWALEEADDAANYGGAADPLGSAPAGPLPTT